MNATLAILEVELHALVGNKTMYRLTASVLYFLCPIDVNECLLSPCSSAATCTNTIGSFICTCGTGYTGDGITCQSMSLSLTG